MPQHAPPCIRRRCRSAPGACIDTRRRPTFADQRTTARRFSACDQCRARGRPHGECRRAVRVRRGPATSDEPYDSTDRTRLLAGTVVLGDGSHRQQESERIALEMEEQGTDVLRNPVGEREQIENARITVRPFCLSPS